MTCPDFDWKSYVLDEVPAPDRRQMEQRLAGCAPCREEVEGLRLTVTALRRLPVREIPKRISFVSDPVFEPSLWQRFWGSASRLGFASAALLAGAGGSSPRCGRCGTARGQSGTRRPASQDVDKP